MQPRLEDLQEYVPGELLERPDDLDLYYTQDGMLWCYRDEIVKWADIASFRAFRPGYGKDRTHCYYRTGRLRGANPATFCMLNNVWATDRQTVWYLGRAFKDADAATFEACDDGHHRSQDGAPYSYGKDRDRVYQYDFDGKPTWLRKADPATFDVIFSGELATDAQYIFSGASIIRKARRDTWRYLNQNYSTDDRRVFYFDTELEGADPESFEVAPTRHPVARDRERYWDCWREISHMEYERQLAK